MTLSPWLLAPPVAFLLLLGIMAILSEWSAKLGARPTENPPGKFKAYACGEDLPPHRMQPDYAHFFPFAFAFTIMHVVALVVAVGPRFQGAGIGLAVLYLAAAGVGLSVLLRK